MKKHRLLTFVVTHSLVISLTAPAFGQGFKANDFVDQPYSPFEGRGSGLKLTTADEQSCKAPRSRLFSRSQSGLISFFKNTSCQTAGKEILGDMLNEVSCRMVNDCFKEKELPLAQKTKERLDSEFMGYMIRENLAAEYDKYQQSESRDLRDLLAYADKMPDDYKKQIKFCPDYKPSSSKCLNENEFDKIAKLYFASFNSKGVKEFDFKSRGRTATLPGQQVPKMKVGSLLPVPQIMAGIANDFQSGFDLWKSGMNQTFQAKVSAQLLKSMAEKSTPEADFSNYVSFEKDWADTMKKNSNSFDPKEDKLLDDIVKAVILDVGKLPENELKEKVIKAVVKYSVEGNDLILSHKKDNAEAIEKLLEKVKFTAADITSSDRQSLSRKMNELRVQLANNAFESDCQKAVVSIGQMCSKVSENLKAGTIKGEKVKTDKLFEAMLDSYKKTNPSQEDFEARKAAYEMMANAKDQVYGRYATLIFNMNSCKEKHPGIIEISEKEKEATTEFINQESRTAQQNKETAAKHIVEFAAKDETFKREIIKSGFNHDLAKYEKIISNYTPAVTEDTKSKFVTTEKFDTSAKPYMADMPVPPGNQNFVSQNTNPSSNGTNAIQPNYNFVNNQPEVQAEKIKPAVNPLEEKLKALEKKESSLRKKMNSAVAESSQEQESDELAALRKQIEELKQEKDKSLSKQAQDSKPKSDVQEKNQVVSGPSAGPAVSALKISGDDSKDSSRNEEKSMARSIGPDQGADYASAGPGHSAALAEGRGPASVGGASGNGGKGGADKAASALVLTKNVELALDSGAILENPNEVDIALAMEKTKGEPFIIRENGELMKITPVLDAKGKLVLSSEGKIKFKKIKLTKAQQELIVKEANVNKAAKEVGVEPVRLYKLKSLLKEVRR